MGGRSGPPLRFGCAPERPGCACGGRSYRMRRQVAGVESPFAGFKNGGRDRCLPGLTPRAVTWTTPFGVRDRGRPGSRLGEKVGWAVPQFRDRKPSQTMPNGRPERWATPQPIRFGLGKSSSGGELETVSKSVTDSRTLGTKAEQTPTPQADHRFFLFFLFCGGFFITSVAISSSTERK